MNYQEEIIPNSEYVCSIDVEYEIVGCKNE